MFTKILLAVDTSTHSAKAVATTAELARSVGGEVHVFHVRPLMSASRAGVVDADLTESERDIAAEVCRELQATGIAATSSRIAKYHGDTGRMIVQAAEEQGAELIVIGSRGHSEIPSLLLGSVAHKVLHFADRPVLIVR